MMYYFKNAAQGTTADGTPLPPSLWQNPIVAVMNAMAYNGMLLGNHEFNFGSEVFTSTFSQAGFPDPGRERQRLGAYGINKVGLDTMAAAQGVKVNVYDGLEYDVTFWRSGQPGQDRLRRPDQSPRAELRAAQQYPWPDLYQPDRNRGKLGADVGRAE